MQKNIKYNVIPVKQNVFNNIDIATNYINDMNSMQKDYNDNYDNMVNMFTLKTELLLNTVGDIDLLRGLMFSKKLFSTLLNNDIFNSSNSTHTFRKLISHFTLGNQLFYIAHDLITTGSYGVNINTEITYSLINSFNSMKYTKETIKIVNNNIYILVGDEIFNNITTIIETSYNKQVLYKESFMELFKVYLNTLTFNKKIVSNNNYTKHIFNLNDFYLKNK